jgi:hypothetical protein
MTSFSAERSGGRYGHHAQQILVAGVIAATALPFLRVDPLLNLAGRVVVLVVMVFAWLKLRDHDRHLCEQCASSMPLNPAEHASRLHRRFNTAHLAQQRTAVVVYLGVLIAADALVLLDNTLPTRLVWAGTQLSMVYLVLAYGSHRRFQPWCPQCANGGTEVQRSGDPLVPLGPAT